MIKKRSHQVVVMANEEGLDYSNLLERQFNELIGNKEIQYDEAQFAVLTHLQDLLDNLIKNLRYQRHSAWARLLHPEPEKCQSLYIFGDVGRGKSMLMALFYEACPFAAKRRVHFNTFMQEVHQFIHQCRQHKHPDAIFALAKNIRESVWLLCFDEFHVTDIADAMILGRLFQKLFELGVIVVITSNRHPNDLYQGGLQREQFLFFIKVLHSSAKIVELVAKTDYRLAFQAQLNNYYFPLDGQEAAFIESRINSLIAPRLLKPVVLENLGRQIHIPFAHQNFAMISFDELCGQPLGGGDYLLLAQRFNLLVLRKIPKMTAEKRNEAKRFVTLIDVLYEHKIKLICSAEVVAQDLYIEGDGVFEFRRTVSRLLEMQSAAYFN